ncbi:MAG: VOC family protein, partial [Acidimicrobiia bacterium]|nr:VOC family protein [Acidimicrobiia bacterium]
RFYSELFGWEFEAPGINIGIGGNDAYTLIRHNGHLIGGMVNTRALGKTENVSQWIAAISVTDIDAAAASITAGGGKILTPPTSLEHRGHIAVAEDPTGAIFALIQTRDGDPADREARHNDFLWDELWTSDVPRATEFYAAVVGFERNDHDVNDGSRQYGVLTVDGTPRAGIIANPFEGERPVWVNYIRVSDPSAVTSRVEALDGRIIVDAQPRPAGGTVALVAGPSGAGIALQTWPLD